VHRNGGKVASCAPEGGGVVGLTVTQGLPAFPEWSGGRAEARARAGPRPGA